MQVINNLSERDINSSLMRLKNDIDTMKAYYNNLIIDNQMGLETKLALVKEYSEKITTYNKVLYTLMDLVKEWCNKNNSTAWYMAMKNWEWFWQTSWSCEVGNSHREMPPTGIATGYDCKVCNNHQNLCGKSYSGVFV